MRMSNWLRTLDNNLRESVLMEGRDAPLFHGTNPVSAVRIIQANEIGANTKHFNAEFQHIWRAPGVSLSRDIRAAKNFGGIVFQIDQAKLSQSQKITPISYYGHSEEPGMHGETGRTGQFAEAEEFVIGSISLPRFVVAIRMDTHTYERLTAKRASPFDSEPHFYRPLTTHPLLVVGGKRIS